MLKHNVYLCGTACVVPHIRAPSDIDVLLWLIVSKHSCVYMKLLVAPH